MRTWYMYFPGPVHPYVRTTQRQKWVDRRYKAYRAWKEAFRVVANAQGVPDQLDHHKKYYLGCDIHVRGKARYDLDNAIKAILDALFRQDAPIREIYAKVYEGMKDDMVVIMMGEMK